MDRRNFLSTSLRAAVAASLSPNALAQRMTPDPPAAPIQPRNLDLNRHRFGVNYTPSKNWWFCWNDWNPDPIQRDLDAIASLGADHLRILLIWPYFQPNPKYVSPLHLDRLHQLLALMNDRHLDAVVTVFTGQLSGWYFLPPFNKPDKGFFTDPVVLEAQELFVRQLAPVVRSAENFIGFDFGNEINTCWRTEPKIGDAWATKMFALMDEAVPHRLHVNGVDQNPWFEVNTFSPQAMAARRFPIMHCYPYWSGAVKYGGPMDPPSIKLLAGMATLIRAYANDSKKPVWAEEFNTCIEELNEKQQAEWLEKSVLAAIDSGVSWFTYWDSHDVDRKFEFTPLEYSLGLLTNDGRVKEQGRVFKQLAETYRGKPVVYPTQPIAQPPPHRTQDATWQWLLAWMNWKPSR